MTVLEFIPRWVDPVPERDEARIVGFVIGLEDDDSAFRRPVRPG